MKTVNFKNNILYRLFCVTVDNVAVAKIELYV